ncbi:ankyrin repeat domain-containing protein [Chryseobacterium potabilaquae]|uniref:Uncharacterized protein n=1 Tax=Chryseobacterium potabilaquae TaxID=2675057 RepID=A0A6N4XFC0_9FLAO|nr:ankyrin repeat domain-containing protein [Chryseobacterium potabilaquae]CAA7197357.1 hypothetical protein CHRY9293_03412 [Chryseobacterium potabilaquae]
MKLYLIILLLILSCNSSCQKPNKNSLLEIKQAELTDNIPPGIDGLKYNKLGLAIKSDNLEEIKKLLKKGSDIEIAAEDEYNEYSALYIAIINRNEKIVKFLIGNKANVNSVLNDEGYTLLITAIKSNDINIVQELLNAGVKLNASTDIEGNKKFIPILESTISNQLDITKLLMENGADPFEKNFENISAFEYAKNNNKNLLAVFESKNKYAEIKGNYKSDCNSKVSFLILDNDNAYLDLITNDEYVRLVMTIINKEVYFNNLAGITRLNKTLDWNSISTKHSVMNIKQVSDHEIIINWIGFYNTKNRKTEISENPFGNNNNTRVHKCE